MEYLRERPRNYQCNLTTAYYKTVLFVDIRLYLTVKNVAHNFRIRRKNSGYQWIVFLEN